MKKALIFILLMVLYTVHSQSVTINTTKYTIDQLVNKVLVNSPCVQGINVTSRTGTTYGSSNGIGYFENTNSAFPFSNGVVLSTGDVTKIPAPNTTILSDGIPAWSGDSDLEANLLSQSGITINSINASYIEFDFQPKTPNFDFSFLFASEEYGTSQCSFSDAFAFLLKDVTAGGTNVNLAVIPSTAIPVSVETIRDIAYNPSCPSASPNYFGAFNGGGFGPAINFNGQTVSMLASATGLDITHVYRIKLVIADGGNNTGYDSAIFLQANSFNIGQNVLGLDYTTANNAAICPGNTLPILSAAGLDSGTTFVWKKQGVAFSPPQTGETLDLNTVNPIVGSGIHNYSVTYKEPGCIEVTDDITIEIFPKIGVITNVPNIYMCDSGASSYDFDLNKNSSIILAGVNQSTGTAGVLDDLPANTIITYYFTDADARRNTAAISILQTISSTESGKQIFVRIQNPNTLCYEIRSFQLLIVASPLIANMPADNTLCSRNLSETPLKANFNLTSQIASITGSQNTSYNILTFHSSETEAKSNTNILTLNSSNQLLSPSTTLWVRLQNISNPSCYVITSFNLIVTPLPEVDVLPDVFVCTSYKLPPLTKAGAQYWSGSNGTGTQLFASDVINTTTMNLYVFNQSGVCVNQDSFNVTIADLDTITPASETYCIQYSLPALPYAKYFTQSGGPTTPGNIQLAAGFTVNTTGLNRIYIWFEDTTVTPSCTKENPFDITIIPFSVLPNYPNQFACTSYTLPVDPNGGVYYTGTNKSGSLLSAGTVINTTTIIYVYKESGTVPKNCADEKTFTVFISVGSITPPTDVNSCSAYGLPALTVGEYRTAAAGRGNIVPAGTLINATTTIWFYVTGQTCTDNLDFTVTVNIAPLPVIPDTTPHCDVYYLPTVAHSGNYYTGPLGTGQLRPVGFPVTTTQKMYFYDKAVSGPCYVEEEFLITINKSPVIDAKPVEVIRCGQSYILDDLRNGEYYEFAGGPSPTNPVLPAGTVLTTSKIIYVYVAATAPNTCVSEYSIDVLVTFVNDKEDQYACNSFNLPAIVGMGSYYTAPSGPNGTGVRLLPPYSPITTTTTIYVYVENNNRVTCTDEDPFTITIYNSPTITTIAPVTRCESYELPSYSTPVTRYFTNPGGPGSNNTEKFPGDFITASTTIYVYAESGTSATVICPAEKPMVITIIEKPKPVLTVPAICIDIDTGITTDAFIESGFTRPQYSFEWKREDGTLVSTKENFSTSEPGNYTLTVANLSIFGCTSDIIPFTVIESSKPASVTFTTSGWFTDNQTITVNAIPFVGDGSNFLYSLDGGSPQSSNVFNNVSSGLHGITVSDANCGTYANPITVRLINSPKFFTPNGDGFNDTWNITGIPNSENLKLYIFDRYGKLLKELFPNGSGWDGTFNGYALPADDYWFSISYTEDTITKEYKSHFSLKR
ncbi:T9SS type B sorting domain-containing protein [Flavobacterium urumqiense]|uniref:Gliding motility-associated C-terminal domain-containing protein n=1 Tax=Flavobacterium urumqiense TaxID=935224 RepID=A0A1H6AF27_9FLAO|nr:T9SS type B sorting domain-containing protein [Flavobacterium urumqiense]SEG47101.1 gliding motility-associated C-terminal domain-containing protein [Flavobacterium urumqiense]